MLKVSVSTMAFGAKEHASDLPEVRLRLVSERLSARDIIARAVAEQIRALREEHPDDEMLIERRLTQQYLAQVDVDRQASQGKVALPARPKQGPQVKTEIERALRAFANNKFKVFVDGTEVTDLDQPCLLRDGTAIKFVRLIPLAGG